MWKIGIVDKIKNLNQEAPSLCRKPNQKKPQVSRWQWAHNLLCWLRTSKTISRDVKSTMSSAGKICSTRIPEFVPPEKKISYRQEFFVRILISDFTFFTFLLSEFDFDLNLASSELFDLKKTGYRSSISCPNFDIVRFIRPEPEFLPALTMGLVRG